VSDGRTVRSTTTLGFVSARFDGDNVRGDRPNAQGSADAGLDVVRCHGAVQQQDVDQGAGAAGIAVRFPGRGPERVVRGRERAGLSGVR
jgi:hypothetical protein